MKRSLKLIRNILLIVIIVSIIGYTKQYRFTPMDVAIVFGEKIFLENPDIKQLSSNNRFMTFLLEEDNVLACSVVEKEYGFVYHPADFGSTFITLNNSDIDAEAFTSKCSSTYDRYYNVSYQDDLKLGNLLESNVYNYNYLEPIEIYKVKDTFAYQFYTSYEPFDKYLDINYQEYLDNPSMHKQKFYYTDTTLGLSSVSNEISTISYSHINRIDENGDSETFVFNYEYKINNPNQLTVSDVLSIDTQLNSNLIMDELNVQFEEIEPLELLTGDDIIEILNQTMRKMNVDIEVNKVEIFGIETVETSADYDKSSLEFYLDFYKLSTVIEQNNLSYDDIKSLTLNEVLNDLDLYNAVIRTSDDKYIHLDANTYTIFGPTVTMSDGNQIQAYFRISREDEFNTLINSRPNLDEIIEKVILESYTEIKTQDDISGVAQNIHQALINNLFLKYSTISISIIGEAIRE